MHIFLPLILLLVTAVPLHAQTIVTPEAMLRPGDRVNILVWRNSELSGNFGVANDGTIAHPLFRHIQVAGVPLETAEQRVLNYLQGFEDSPRLLFMPEYRIFVGGEVRIQSQFHHPEISVAEAITLAGGSTAPDRRLRLRLIRDGAHTVISLDDPEVASVLQAPIRSGDQILMEQRPTFSRNYLGPALQALQTITALAATYVYLDAVFGR